MRLWKILLALTLVPTLFASCVSTRADMAANIQLPPNTLSAAEVTVLFSGKTVESVLDSSGRVSLTYYNPNGQLRQLQDGQLRSGQWHVRDDGRICLQFTGDSAEKCRIIVKEGTAYRKYIVRQNGQHQPIITYKSFRDGNLVDK